MSFLFKRVGSDLFIVHCGAFGNTHCAFNTFSRNIVGQLCFPSELLGRKSVHFTVLENFESVVAMEMVVTCEVSLWSLSVT